jgi:hypothetical protein
MNFDETISNIPSSLDVPDPRAVAFTACSGRAAKRKPRLAKSS